MKITTLIEYLRTLPDDATVTTVEEEDQKYGDFVLVKSDLQETHLKFDEKTNNLHIGQFVR